MAKKNKLRSDIERFYSVVGEALKKVPLDEFTHHAHMKSCSAMKQTHVALVETRKVFHSMARDSHREAEFLHRKASSAFPSLSADHIQCANLHRQMLEYHRHVINPDDDDWTEV